ncbi:MAG: hypothetical protein KF735_25930 [Chelatococcus sp.]|jgi:hypothetical protein|uniref:hypothetical protein n=1 Tax=unclassified Chelatococcus TaxID=2638111 RepID=UPI001BD13580|nr:MULTISPECIES: hypothetical protein [unclassified Chelatococcus]CAH1668970.1 conserved hypothetical protein [Hyphomicrobiales bacterium]MBS7738145.1 hypothetical protein [Chelatococcus sp. HY11]MBX3541105.1 hypothetical protein [Chelatococcus sp.]MBX3546908.1 hypothetical protein [Chelatococcus sp.]MCO5077509.1 hypothetical protein [Chelatococcus sp.]
MIRSVSFNGLSKKTVAAGLAGLTLLGGLVAGAGEASAGWYGRHGYYRYHGGNGGAVAAGIVGGLALGALAAGAARASAPPPPAWAYDGYDDGPACYVAPRRVWVEGWGWSVRRVTVCD